MSTALHAFQHAFAHALRHGGHDGPLARQRGFAVYRNTVMKGCSDALHAQGIEAAQLMPGVQRGGAVQFMARAIDRDWRVDARRIGLDLATSTVSKFGAK